MCGDVRCGDLRYCSECTGMAIGGALEVRNLFYTDCGNSVLQVKGDFSARHACVVQCSIEVRGEERFENGEADRIAEALGIDLEPYGGDADEALEAYLDQREFG